MNLHLTHIRIACVASVVYRMEFNKTRWSCSWNSDQNCTQNSARGSGDPGVQGVVVGPRGCEGGESV